MSIIYYKNSKHSQKYLQWKITQKLTKFSKVFDHKKITASEIQRTVK